MSTPTPPTAREEAEKIGQALVRLRERAGMTQEAAGLKIGVTRQGWQNYEKGDRLVVLRSDMQQRLAAALGYTRQDLLDEADRPEPAPGAPKWQTRPVVVPTEPGGNVYELPVWSRAKAGQRAELVHDFGLEPDTFVDMGWLFGPNTGTVRVAGDSMTGYVESGQLVIFDRSRWPRRGDGCVVETTGGELYVKEFQRQEGGTLYVRQLFPEEVIEFPMAEVKGVYSIRLRGD